MARLHSRVAINVFPIWLLRIQDFHLRELEVEIKKETVRQGRPGCDMLALEGEDGQGRTFYDYRPWFCPCEVTLPPSAPGLGPEISRMPSMTRLSQNGDATAKWRGKIIL